PGYKIGYDRAAQADSRLPPSEYPDGFPLDVRAIELHQSLARRIANLNAKRFPQRQINSHELVKPEMTGRLLVNENVNIGIRPSLIARVSRRGKAMLRQAHGSRAQPASDERWLHVCACDQYNQGSAGASGQCMSGLAGG